MLRRSPLLLGILLAYPLAIAAAGRPGRELRQREAARRVRRRGQPAVDRRARRQALRRRPHDRPGEQEREARAPLPGRGAARSCADGRVVAVVTVPPGFVSTLRGMVRSPQLELQLSTRHDLLAGRAAGAGARLLAQPPAPERVHREQPPLRDADPARRRRQLPRRADHGARDREGRSGCCARCRRRRGRRSCSTSSTTRGSRSRTRTTRSARPRTRSSSCARPGAGARGRSRPRCRPTRSALTITFLALLLAAGSLAAERDENVVGRLARGLVGLGQLVWSKVALAAAVALALGLAIALAFGLIIEIGGVTGGEPWRRLPLLVVGLVLAGGSLGALGALLGALAREARSASLVALLVVMPIVFLGLIPAEVVPPAGWLSDAAAVRARGALLPLRALRPEPLGRGRCGRASGWSRSARSSAGSRGWERVDCWCERLSGHAPAPAPPQRPAARARARDPPRPRRLRPPALRRAGDRAEPGAAGARPLLGRGPGRRGRGGDAARRDAPCSCSGSRTRRTPRAPAPGTTTASSSGRCGRCARRARGSCC